MHHFTTTDGLRLAYDDHGTGTPVLCLAGLTRNMDDFATVMEGFGDRARIIRLDSRGRGSSDYDPAYANYNLARESEDAIALLDHLGLQKVVILGTSRGGLIAMLLAATHPDRLAGVVLNDIGPELLPQGLENIMDYLGKPPAHRTLAEATKALPGFMGSDFANVSSDTWAKRAHIHWYEDENGLHLRYDPALRKAMEESATGEAPDLWPLFQALAPFPLALIRGENSNLLGMETVARMQDKRPDMIFANVPDRGHVPFLDEPESVAVISQLLDQVE